MASSGHISEAYAIPRPISDIYIYIYICIYIYIYILHMSFLIIAGVVPMRNNGFI